MSVVKIPTSAVGFRESIVKDARAAQMAVNKIQMSPQLNPSGIIQPLGRIIGSASEFQKSMDASAARVFAFGAAVGVINGVSDAFRGMIAATAEVEKSLKDIQVVMEASDQAMKKFGSGLFDVARNTATSLKDVAESATELARQGLSAEETLARVNSALVLSRLSGLGAVKSTETLTAAINSFNKEGINHTEIVNRMANVDAAFAVSSADLAEAISRAGAVAQSSGVSFNQLSAVITAVQQRTARGGSVIGNGFKSIFTRIKRSGVRESLEEIGVATKNLDGSFRSAMAVILDYADVYKTLSDSQKAYTSEQLAGVYQIQNLQALLQDLNSGFSVYNQALKVANNTTDEATRRNEQLNVTLDALFKQSKLSAQELAASLGEVALSGNFKEILTFLDGLAQKLNSLLSEEGGSNLAKNLVRGIGSFITGPGLVILGAAFIKIFGLVTKFAKEAFSDILGINSETKRQQSLQAAIGQVLSTNAGVYQKILAAGSNTAKQEQIILNLIKQETAERIKQEALIKRIAAGSRLAGIGASEQGYVPMGKRSSRTKGKKALGMANGFLPAFAKESSDIYNGVGGARKNDRAVRTKIKTTPGRSSDVVVNTGEWVVRNFQGSGADAVFNRDMAKSYGLPEGAKKVTAASGFIPNFSKGKFSKFHNENMSYTARELGAFSGTTGKSNLSKFADNSDRFTGKLKVSRMNHDNKYFKQAGVDIKNNLIVRDQKFFERTGKIKYNVNQEYKQSLYKKYGDLLKGGVYSGIFTHAENISKAKPYTGSQPRNMRRAFGGLVDKAKGLEGERQGKVFLSGKKGLENIRYAKSNDFFDLQAEKKLPGGFKRSSLYENKATGKQNIVEVLKKGANRYLSNLVGMQKSWGAEPIGIKNNKLDHVNLTQGKGAAMRGGLNLITAKDTSLYRSKITNTANKKNTVIQKDDNYAKGFVPNFADTRNRYQKIKDVLADPANKNVKFNSPTHKEMSIQTVKKGMGGEFQKMWLESYFKKGGGSDYQMLLKMGYDPDQLAKLRKHYERGGPVNIKTLAQGFIPNLSAGGVLTKKGLLTPQQINRIRQGRNAKNKETGEQLYLGKFSAEDQKKILGFEAQFSNNVMATQKQETKNKRNKLKTIDASRQATMLVATNNLRRKVDSTITPKGGEKTRLKYRAEGIKSSVLKGTESGLRERMENSMIRESQNLAREISGGGQFSANNPVIKKIANAGSIGSASGAVFETALSSVGNNKLFTKNNATFDISGFPDGRLQKLFGYYTPFADAKIGISADTKRDFNEKLLKLPSVQKNINKQQTKKQGRTAASTRKKFGGPSNLAGGYIPNFALNKPQKQFLVNNNFAKNHKEAGKNFTELDYFYISEKNMSKPELERQRKLDKQANLMTGVSRYAGASEKKPKRFGASIRGRNKVNLMTNRANMGAAGAAYSVQSTTRMQGQISDLSKRVSRLENGKKVKPVNSFALGYIPNFAKKESFKDKQARLRQAVRNNPNDKGAKAALQKLENTRRGNVKQNQKDRQESKGSRRTKGSTYSADYNKKSQDSSVSNQEKLREIIRSAPAGSISPVEAAEFERNQKSKNYIPTEGEVNRIANNVESVSNSNTATKLSQAVAQSKIPKSEVKEIIKAVNIATDGDLSKLKKPEVAKKIKPQLSKIEEKISIANRAQTQIHEVRELLQEATSQKINSTKQGWKNFVKQIDAKASMKKLLEKSKDFIMKGAGSSKNPYMSATQRQKRYLKKYKHQKEPDTAFQRFGNKIKKSVEQKYAEIMGVKQGLMNPFKSVYKAGASALNSGTGIAKKTLSKALNNPITNSVGKKIDERIFGVPINMGKGLNARLPKKDAESYIDKKRNLMLEMKNNSSSIMSILNGGAGPGYLDELKTLERNAEIIKIKKEALDDFYKKQAKSVQTSRYARKGNSIRPVARRGRRLSFNQTKARYEMPNFASFFKGVRKRQQGGFYDRAELKALEKAKKGINERGGISLRDGKTLDNNMPFGQLSARDLDLLTINLIKFGGVNRSLAKKVYQNYTKNTISLNKAKIKKRGDFYNWGKGVSENKGYKRQESGELDFFRTSRLNAAAGGFVPNFSLNEAITRESNALKQRGISSNKIKVEKNSILKSESNPMGLAVTNTVDEPMGVQQGINRAIKEGKSPKTYGVPTFASRRLTAEEKELERKKADFRLEEEKRRESRKGRSSLFNPYSDMEIDEAFELDQKQKKYKRKTEKMGTVKRLRKHGMSPLAQKRMKALGQTGQNASMGAMFMGPMAAEMIRDGREDNAVGGGGRMGMDLMNSAAMGAAFGPKGMVIGAAAGLASGAANYSNRDDQAKTFESLEAAKRNLDKQLQDTSSIQNFGQSIADLQRTTELGDTKGIIAANKQIRKSISSIADPEIKKRMNEIASSGISTSEKLGLVSQALEKLGTDAEINAQLIKVGKTTNSEKNMGPNSLQNSFVGDSIQNFMVDAVGDFQQLTGSGRNDDFTKLALSGKDAFMFREAEGKDFAKQTGDLLQKEIDQISKQSILKDLSAGKVQFGNFNLQGLSPEEIAQKRSGGGKGSLELDARIKEFEDEYFQELLDKTSRDLLSGNITNSEVGQSIAKRDGGNETLSNIERLTTRSKEDGGGLYTGGAMLLGELTDAMRESKDAVLDHSEAISVAVSRQNEIANLEQKLIQEYQAMIQAQQAVSNMMSNFESNQRVSEYRSETSEIAARGANEFLTKRNYTDPNNYVDRDAQISRNSVVRESTSSLNAQLISEIGNAINMDTLYDPDQSAKQQMQVPDDDLTGRKAVDQEIAEANRQSERAMASTFAQFAAQNQDGNITLDETKALIQQLKSTGDRGNQISQMANNLEKANNKEIIAKLERIAVNTLLQKGALASSNLEKQGGNLLGVGALKTGAELAIKGSDNDGDNAMKGIRSNLEGDPGYDINFSKPEGQGAGFGPPTDAAAETINALRLLADQMGISQQMFTGMNDDMANYIVAMANVENQLAAIEAFDPDTATKMRSVFEQVKANLKKDYETTQEVAKKLKEIAVRSDGIDPTLVKDPVDKLNVNLTNLWGNGLQITNMNEVSQPLTSINEGISELVALGGGGGGDGSFAEAVSALSSSVEELTSLPEKMNEQLSQLVINHEVKGGITFDFNSDVVRSQLTPAMEEGLKSILQEGIILDYLATALAPRIKLNQIPD